MRNIRHIAVLIAFVIAMAARVSTAAPEFYTNLLRRGIGEFNAGRYASASTLLRTAAFGLLDSIDQFETAQTYIAVASDRLGRDNDARQATRRILQAERVQRRFALLPLPPELRTEFDSLANRYLTGAEHAALKDATSAVPPRQGGDSSVRRSATGSPAQLPPPKPATATSAPPVQAPAAAPRTSAPAPAPVVTEIPAPTLPTPERTEEKPVIAKSPEPATVAAAGKKPEAAPTKPTAPVVEPQKPATKPATVEKPETTVSQPPPAPPTSKAPAVQPTAPPVKQEEPAITKAPAAEPAPVKPEERPATIERAPQPEATPAATAAAPKTVEPEIKPAPDTQVTTASPAVSPIAETPEPVVPKVEPKPASPQTAPVETPAAKPEPQKPAPAPSAEAVREAQREFERKVAEVERGQKPSATTTTRDVTKALQDATATLDKGDTFGARAQLRAILETPNLKRADILRIAEESYRAQDFRLSTEAFARAGALQKGEEALGYYRAVALYETGQYVEAKAALAAALPFIEATEAVARYRAKIEGAVAP